MQNERKSSGINIGSASIIMVFSVLCLTVFAVLTFVTANSEYKLAERSADAVENYYAADTAASEKTAALKELINSGKKDFSAVTSEAEKMGIGSEKASGGILLSFSEKITDGQELSVKLIYNGDKLSVEEWKIVNTGNWNPNEHVDLWDGEF